jgi:hypothetical protein
LICSGAARARSAPIADRNLWAIVSLTGPLLGREPEAGRWRYTFDAPQRFGDDLHRFSQGVWRAGVGYLLTPRWSVWAGYSHTYTDTPYARAPSREHRGFQQLLWGRRVRDLRLNYRLRFEARSPDTGRDTGLRLRHQFRVSHPIRRVPPLSWIVSEEIILNLNATDYGARQGLDQNRAFAGVGWAWSPISRSEAGYMHQLVHRPGGPDRHNHVLAVSLAFAFQ